jgi:hypothetical protein
LKKKCSNKEEKLFEDLWIRYKIILVLLNWLSIK